MIVDSQRLLASLLLPALSFLALPPGLAQDDGGAAPRTGPVANWKFDEGKGEQALDSSGQANHGRIHGPVWTEGRTGGGLQFDGADDYVEVPRSATLNSLQKEITLMAWINTPLTQRQSIFARWLYGGGINQRCLELDVSPERKIVSFALSADGVSGNWAASSNAVPTDQWVHIAATSDGTTMRIYINGQQDPSTRPAPSLIHPSEANLHIGAWFSEGKLEGFFKGTLDDLRIYSRALTHDEIVRIYADASPKGTVMGKVINIDGKAIGDAEVRIGLFRTQTGKDGTYSLSVPVGACSVQVFKKGYSREVKPEVEARKGKTTAANVLLTEDEIPPEIFDVLADNVASLTAVMKWRTDDKSDAVVRYGNASGKCDGVAKDSEYSRTHRVVLSGLKPETKYYCYVQSADEAGNAARSKEFSFTTQKSGGVILWDTNLKYTMKNPASFAMADKAKWTQIPYGATDYEFVGDAMLENDYCYLFLFTNKEDSVALIAKLEGGGWVQNEIYKVYEKSLRYFGMGTMYTKILKHTPELLEVEHAGENLRSGVMAVTTNYVLRAGKPWLEIVPVKSVNQQGMHGKTRLSAFVKKDGTELLFDAKREPWTGERNIPAPDGAIGIINFFRGYSSTYDFMWFLTFPPGAEKNSLTYLGFHEDPFWGEEISPDRPSVGAQYAYMGNKVAIGVLRYRNCWTRENVEKTIKAGEVRKSHFTPPYPGKWRLIARFDQTLDAEEVNISKQQVAEKARFAFTSKTDGKLDYFVMYLLDRNEDTPGDVYTPMDVYRQAILGKE